MLLTHKDVHICIEERVEVALRILEGFGEHKLVEVIEEEDADLGAEVAHVGDDLAGRGFPHHHIVIVLLALPHYVHKGLDREGVVLG